MSQEARALLKKNGLRATAPRVAVVRALTQSTNPLSCSELLGQLDESGWSLATVYRNLVRLTEEGVTVLVSRVHGINRYALANVDEAHEHPHFVCTDCGRLACLPTELFPAIPVEGPWAQSLRQATLQFQGTCPDCLDAVPC